MDIIGRLSLTLTGLTGGARLPTPLTLREGKERGAGRLHEGRVIIPDPRLER